MRKHICAVIAIALILPILEICALGEEYIVKPFVVCYREEENKGKALELTEYKNFGKYVEDYLPYSATEYSHDLAELLMAFAYSAYDNDACYRSYMNFAFDDIHFYSHNAITENHEELIDALIGVGIGRKTLSDDRELIMISIRGTSTGNPSDILEDLKGMLGITGSNEWASDFDFTPDSNGWHRGFAQSAWVVYAKVKEYISSFVSNKDNMVFVVNGHSRGAAVANLVSVLLSQSLERDTGIYVSPDRVYDYNFACPDVALSGTIDSAGQFNNIFNFNLASDFVPYVPGILGDIIDKNIVLLRSSFQSAVESFLNIRQNSMLLYDNWGKYGNTFFYAKDWDNPADCAIDFDSHAQLNYLHKLAYAKNHQYDGMFRNWWESRIPVYISTAKAGWATLMGQSTTLMDQNIKVFELEGMWMLTDDSGTQYTVNFDSGRTNLFDIMHGQKEAVLPDSYFLYPSASNAFALEIHSLNEGNTLYICNAKDDNTVEMYTENLDKLFDLTRISRSDSATKNRAITDDRSIVLVIDTAGSMSGKPMQETVKAAGTFIGDIAHSDANIGIIDFDSSATIISPFGKSIADMSKAIVGVDANGGTNISDGLSVAADMLNGSNAKKKIIILMSDGEPESGLTGEDLFAYADELKDSGIIIYTLGFFSEMGDNKAMAQQIMERIASPGYHYEIDSPDNLRFLFNDVADQLNGQRFIFVRIECPVDVEVSYAGEKLSSSASNQNLRTSFGTLSFEESIEEEPVNDGADRRTKVLRLKEGVDYPIAIQGTGQGSMTYSVGLMDGAGEYNDFRRFENIPITSTTKIDTVANAAKATTLNVDTDNDGSYDETYVNTPNGKAMKLSGAFLKYIIIVAIILLLFIELYARNDEIVIKKPSMRSKDE